MKSGHKTAIELAREAGICTWLKPPEDVTERIERFADLIRADERERMLAGVEIAALKALVHPVQEAVYGMNQDDWKDLTDAVKKVRDGRGIYLACQPADVFQDWFLRLGTAKIMKGNK